MSIRQRSGFFGTLLNEVKEGYFANAPFNRKYVWEREDVLAFFDSLRRRYPIGTFIIWTPPKDEREALNEGAVRVGPILPTPSLSPSFILDGHNRLATLAWAGMSPEEMEAIQKEVDCDTQELETWCADGLLLVLNAETMKIDFMTPGHAELDNHIAAHYFIGSDYRRHVISRAENAFSNEALDNLDLLYRNILETRIVITDVNEPGIEAFSAFQHLNRIGKAVSETDLEKARKWFDGIRA